MRVLVAPNAFKGSLSCVRAAQAMARGVRSVRPQARVRTVPISDGGDGLIDALREALGGETVSAPAHGPRGERRRATYLWIARSRTAVIEMARASGLALVPLARRRVMAATSRGTGDLMRDAVRRGARTIVVGMGGSASNDGGAGMARALGARLLDGDGRELEDGAESLSRLARVDGRPARALLTGVKVIALSDVTNPLLGPNGSARVFGPQKGATPGQVKRLERALSIWARALNRDLGVSVAAIPGAGAAGGLGAGLLAFAGARIIPGAAWILAKTGALRALSGIDLVLTAEGRLDRTSLFGKAPVALAREAKARGIVCVAIAGQVEARSRGALKSAGVSRVVSFADAGAASQSDSLKRAARWAARAAAMAAAVFVFAALAAPDIHASDAPSPGSFDAGYFQRHVGSNLERNIAGLEAALASSQAAGDPNLKAGYLWRLCRAKVRRAEKQTERGFKLEGYASAKENCEASVSLSSQTADAHFWLGVTIGRWGETKGLLKALFVIKPIKNEMAETLRLDPGHGGAHHVLGEILWQVPGFAGGDKKRALSEFEEAVRLSPNYTANYMPLAEAYLHYGRTDEAVALLERVAAVREPADPAEFPDNKADADALLKKIRSR